MNCSGNPSSRLHGGVGHQTASVESAGEDLGQVQQLGVRQLSTDSADNPRTSADAALERRLATGRESQRRFRERQKVQRPTCRSRDVCCKIDLFSELFDVAYEVLYERW